MDVYLQLLASCRFITIIIFIIIIFIIFCLVIVIIKWHESNGHR